MDGVNPELSNLTCSMTVVEPGDVVFLTSDGISDNFDPVVGKFCVPKKPERQGGVAPSNGSSTKPNSNSSGSSSTSSGGGLPSVSAYQRHELTLLRMEDLLNHGSGSEIASPHSQCEFNCNTSPLLMFLNPCPPTIFQQRDFFICRYFSNIFCWFLSIKCASIDSKNIAKTNLFSTFKSKNTDWINLQWPNYQIEGGVNVAPSKMGETPTPKICFLFVEILCHAHTRPTQRD